MEFMSHFMFKKNKIGDFFVVVFFFKKKRERK